jgi:hypothetical protein
MMIKVKLLRQVCGLVSVGVVMCCAAASTYAQDDQATELLQQMSAEIASLDRFIINSDGYTDDRLDAGQIIEHSMDVTMRMNRRDVAMRITNRDAQSTKEMYFGSGVFTVYSQTENFYAQRDLPGGVDAAAKFAIDELGIDAPLLDFVFSDVANNLLEDAESVDYFGLSLFRGNTYHHIGIRDSEIDVQLWIAAEGPPLPGKMAISSKWEGGSPRSVFFFSWDTKPEFGVESFSFEPPAGAVKIGFNYDMDQ